jgi:signal transduction histidine kinase
VLADLSAPLRDEQQQAWQRLVRVLGHEINNSLAPIKSIAQTLVNLARRDGDSISQEDTIESLQLIASRADALGRFVAGYATLARLPEPMSQPMSLAALNQRVANLETRVPVSTEGPEIDIMADPDQLEQALINLVRNAVDVTPPGGAVEIRWLEEGSGVLVEVLDRGPGPPDTDNLFVPFFTTKPGGSGIGLLLARRIAENHSGWLNLLSRDDGIGGAVARLWLPKVATSADSAAAPKENAAAVITAQSA